jgi:hypothetical protein
VSNFQAGRKTLADNYEYVMQGKLYKISEDTSSQNAKVYGFLLFPELKAIKQCTNLHFFMH